MANNAEVTLKFRVSEDGSLSLVTKNIDKASKSTRELAKSQREAAKAGEEHNYKLNQGVSGVSSAARSFSKLSQTIGDGPNGLVGAYATLAANAFAVSAAFNTLKNAKQAEQLLQGLEAQGARTGRTLTGLAKQVQELSGASLSSAESMRAVAQASTAGIKTDDIRRLTEVATASAKALGRDVPDSLNRLIMAVTKAEPELVDELGLTIKLTEAQEMYARETGKTASSLSRLEKQQALINAWAGQGEVKFGALAEAVDANPYDRLAAAFTDLSNSILGFINNSGVAAFVEFLATDKLALTAAVIFFASTIKGQLLPVLTEAASAAENLSKKRLSELDKEKVSLTKIQDELIKHKKANEDMLESISGVKRIPKDYKAWLDLEKQGIDATKERTQAEESLTRSMKRFEGKAKSAETTEEAESYREKAAIRAQDLANMQRYSERRDALQQGMAKAETQRANIERETLVKTAQVQAQSSRADAISSLSNFELRASYMSLIASTQAYKESITQEIVLKGQLAGVTNSAALANTALNRTLIVTKTALFGAVTGVKALGSAILTWLPYLGLAVLAWDALVSIWDSIKPDIWKKQEEAFSDLSEILDSTTKKYEAYNQIQNKNGEVTQKSEALLINRTNTLKESIGSFNQYTTAMAKASAAEEKTSSGVSRLGENIRKTDLFTGTAITLWESWVNTTNKELGIPLDSLAQSLFKITPMSSDAEKATASFFASMEKGIPATTKKFAELNKNFEGLNKEARQEAIAEWGKKIAPAIEQAQKAVDELSSNLNALSNDWTDFIRSISATTPYDKLASSLSATEKSIVSFRSSITSGIFEQKDVDAFLQNITEASSRLPASILGKVGIEIRNTIQTTDDALTRLRGKQELFSRDSVQYKNIAQSIKNLEEERLKLSSQLAVQVDKNLGGIKATVQQSQLDSINAQSALALAQARLGVITRQGKISADDVNREIDAKNKIVDLQVAQIEANKVFLEMEVNKKELEVESAVRRAKEIEDLAKRNQKELEFYEIVLRGTKAQLARGAQTAATISQISDIDKQIRDIEGAGGSKENLETQLATAQTAVEDAKKAQELAQSMLDANSAQAAAAALSRVTDAERLYEVSKQILANDREQWSLEKARNDSRLVAFKQTRQLLDIEKSGMGEATRRIEVLKEEFRLRRLDEEKRYEFQKRELGLEITKASSEGRTQAVEILQKRVSVLTEENKLRQTNVTLEERLAIYSEIDLNTNEKKLEVLNRSLEVYKKQADLQSTVLDKEQELYKLTVQNQRRGQDIGSRAEKAIDFRALQEQLALAKQQLELKKLGIKLEYDLLEAQRRLLVEELKAKEAEARRLASTSPAGSSEQEQAQQMASVLSTSIDSLAKNSYNALKENALKIADLDIRILEERAKQAYNEIVGSFVNETLGVNNPAAKLLAAIDDTALIIKNLQEGKSVQEATTKLSPDTVAQVSSLDLNTQAINSLEETLVATNNARSTLTQSPVDIVASVSAHVEKAGEAIATSIATATAESASSEMSRQWTKLKPWESPFRKTSDFGMREHPVTGGRKFHSGVDYAYPMGTPLKAQEAGIVGFVGTMGGYGKVVDVYTGELENGIKVFRRFAHLMDSTVKVGQKLSPGDMIGRTGNTGRSTGPHLHLETRVGTAGAGSPINPSLSPSMQGFASTGSTESDQIVVEGKKTSEQLKAESRIWSDIIKNARAELKGTSEDISLTLVEGLAAASPTITALTDQLKTLGPNGEVVATIAQGMITAATAIDTSVQSFGTSHDEYRKNTIAKLSEDGELTKKELAGVQDQGEYTASKLAGAFSAASAVIGGIASILQSTSQARIASIDKEIAAEQKRDGKSAQSLSKIDAMEKKKDAMAKKAFNTNKKLMMAQAVMATAAAVAQTLGQGGWFAIPLAIAVGAMGAAQLAIIAGTQYESSYAPKAAAMPSSVSIGKRSDTVNLASGPNMSAGGEVGYLRGASGTGTSASNYRTVGSAYGGDLMRGYGNRGFVVGEKGPEVISPETPINVTPANDVGEPQTINASINIQALDASDVKKVLVDQRGNIIDMLREAANNSGQSFLEGVNTNAYTRPNVGKL